MRYLQYWIERWSFHATDSEIRFGKSFLFLYYEETLWTSAFHALNCEAATKSLRYAFCKPGGSLSLENV